MPTADNMDNPRMTEEQKTVLIESLGIREATYEMFEEILQAGISPFGPTDDFFYLLRPSFRPVADEHPMCRSRLRIPVEVRYTVVGVEGQITPKKGLLFERSEIDYTVAEDDRITPKKGYVFEKEDV